MTKQTSKWRNRLAIVATGFAALGAFTVANPSDADALTPTVSLNNSSVGEGNNGQKVMIFVAKLSMPAPGPQWIKVQSYVNSGASAADFVPATVAVQFPQNATQMIFGMTIKADIMDESDESFGVKIVEKSPGLDIADGIAFGVITDDDAPPVMTINDVSKKEGTGPGTTSFTFTAKLSAPSGKIIKADAEAKSGTAHVGDDLSGGPVTLNFNPGVTAQNYTAHVGADAKVEPTEQFTVELSEALNTVITDKTGVGTISNDDFLVIDPPKDPKPDPDPQPEPQPQPDPGNGGDSQGGGGGNSGGGSGGGTIATPDDAPESGDQAPAGEGEQALGEDALGEASPAERQLDWTTSAMLALLGACALGLIMVTFVIAKRRREERDSA